MNSRSFYRNEFINTLNSILPIEDLQFFLNIETSGIMGNMPFIKLTDDTIIFGKRKRVSEFYDNLFKIHKRLFINIGIIEKSFAVAYDALNFFYYENCSKYFLRTNFIKKGDVVLDIGCRSGHFAIKASPIVGSAGKIYCIDATTTSKISTCRHIKYNNLTNVNFEKGLIGNKKEIVDFYAGSDNETYSGIFEEAVDRSNNKIISSNNHESKKKLLMNTIDDFIQEHSLERLDFISLQINGAEPLAVQGALKSIKRFKPVIYATVFLNPKKSSNTKKEFFDILTPLGYDCILEDKEEVVCKHYI